MSSRVPPLAVLLLFAAFSVALTYPLALHLGDHLRDVGDSYEYAWVLGFGAYQLTHDLLHLFDGNILYPFPLSLAYSDSTIPNVVLGTPLVLLTGNAILAHNLLVLLTFTLSGWGMFLFVASRTGSRLAGVLAGVAYAFSPLHVDHLPQLPNLSLEWTPFALASFERYLATSRQRWAASFVAFVVLQTLASFYYAFILGLGVALFVSSRLAQIDRSRLTARLLLPLAVWIVVGGLVATPFVLPYFAVERAFGLKRTLGEAVAFSAWPTAYLTPPPTTRVVLIEPLLSWLAHHHPASLVEAGERHLYPGTLVVALALIGIVRRPWWRVVAPVAMVLAGLAFSFGPTFHLTPTVTVPLPFPLPYTLLYDLVPGFAALRVPARFGALVLLGLAILAGEGLAELRRLAQQRPTPGVALLAALLGAGSVAIVLLEGVNAFPLEPVRTGAAVPPVYRWLAEQPHPSPVVEFPIDANAFHQGPLAYYSTYHHQPLVNGSRSFLPPGYDGLAALLASFPSPESVAALQRLDVRYAIVHRAAEPPSDPLVDESQVAGLSLASRFDHDEVERVSPSDPSASSEEVDLLAAHPGCLPASGASATLAVTLLSRNRASLLIFSPATRELAFELVWQGRSGAAVHQVSRVPIPAPILAAPASFSLPYNVPLRRDVYTVRITLVDQPGMRAETTIADVVVGDEPGDENKALPRLTGALLPTARPLVASGVPYALVWQAPATLPAPLVVFVNAYDEQNRYWSFPSGREAYLDRGRGCPAEETIASDRLPLQPNTPPGRYWIETGLLDPTTGRRVPFVGPDGATVTRIVLGTFWVLPPGVYPAGAIAPGEGSSIRFGDEMTLDNWRVDGALRPGGIVDVGLRWVDRRPTTVDYTVFVHVDDPSGKVVAQHDGPPAGGSYPTSAWLPGETIVEHHRIELPGALPPGSYRIAVGLYDLRTMRRLPVVDSSGMVTGDQAILATFTP